MGDGVILIFLDVATLVRGRWNNRRSSGVKLVLKLDNLSAGIECWTTGLPMFLGRICRVEERCPEVRSSSHGYRHEQAWHAHDHKQNTKTHLGQSATGIGIDAVERIVEGIEVLLHFVLDDVGNFANLPLGPSSPPSLDLLFTLLLDDLLFVIQRLLYILLEQHLLVIEIEDERIIYSCRWNLAIVPDHRI
jgi:hypothetical protein